MVWRVLEIDWSRQRTIAELWEIREEITRQRGFGGSFDETRTLIEAAAAVWLDAVYSACPALLEEPAEQEGISVPTDLLRSPGESRRNLSRDARRRLCRGA